MKMNDKHYQCACCGNVYEKGQTDEDADAEFRRNFPGEDPKDAFVMCSTCFERQMSLLIMRSLS